jgi:hypothetical protein
MYCLQSAVVFGATETNLNSQAAALLAANLHSKAALLSREQNLLAAAVLLMIYAMADDTVSVCPNLITRCSHTARLYRIITYFSHIRFTVTGIIPARLR